MIDDTYNANPDSMRAAIDVLAACPAPTLLVLGDMGEVGEQGPRFHREVGAYARAQGRVAASRRSASDPRCGEAFGEGAGHFDGSKSWSRER